MSDSLKFCKDCKFYEQPKSEYAEPRCLHPSSTLPPDLVNGKVRQAFCGVVRETIGGRQCGPTAFFFEPRETQAAAVSAAGGAN